MSHLKYATQSRLSRLNTKLLQIKGSHINHRTMEELPQLLDPDTLMVVNNAATIPASLRGYVGSIPVELRLIRNIIPSISNIRSWIALLFHGGSWKKKTEDRHDPDFAEVGDIIEIGTLQAEITSLLHPSKRLITIKFIGDLHSVWQKLYQHGHPIQYSYLEEKLHLWDVQTVFSSIPVAVEPPSASFQFSWDILNRIHAKGITIVPVTHAIGISSTGKMELDDLLPFPEYYWISENAAGIIQNSFDQGQRILGVGTSITRALEDNITKFGSIRAGQFETSLHINQHYQRKIVTDLWTGMHLPDGSHFELLRSFLDIHKLDKAYEEAMARNYLWHEYGDVSLIQS